MMEGDIQLRATSSKRLKRTIPDIDYRLCVICQTDSRESLCKIQSTTQTKLIVAMAARADDVTDRLENEDVNSEIWLNNEPKWHNKCRNVYINEKSYLLAERKRQNMISETLSPPDSASSSCLPVETRSKLATFDAKTTCVICDREWHKHKRPTSKVETIDAQKNIHDQAERLNRQDILHRLVGHGCDMVANDICYHMPCMNRFRATRVITGKSTEQQQYDIAFSKLTDEIEIPLFQNSQGFLIKTLRDRYRENLEELGVEHAESYRSSVLKEKLLQHFGTRVSIIEHSYEAGFICASNVPIGDALKHLTQLQKEINKDPKEAILQKAAKILRADTKLCKKEHKNDPTTDISLDAASHIVPDSVFNFTASLLCDKVPPKTITEQAVRVDVDQHTKEKALIMSQQILQQVSGVTTPLGVSTAYHIYNQTRSKSLIQLNNKLGQGISYDSLQRQLTSQSLTIMNQIEEDGVYVPNNMSDNGTATHMYAMDNLDWKKKTLEGGSFNATTAIIIESPSNEDDLSAQSSISISSSSTRRKTLPPMTEPSLPQCYVSATDRQNSRSLNDIQSIESLQTVDDGSAHNLLLVWRLCRFVPSSSQLLDVYADKTFPGFSSFCAQVFPKRRASKIAYLPMIPSSPTDPAVLKEEMTRLVRLSDTLGDTRTVITGDQATYELAMAVRDKNKDQFDKVILLLGGFHLAHNYLMAICKIIRESGAEDVLVASGLCLKGTTAKMFGHKADYYQTMHVINIFSEAMWRLFWEEFENWSSENDMDNELIRDTEKMLQILCDQSKSREEQLSLIEENQAQLDALQNQITMFRESRQDRPTGVFWMNFLDMADIIHKFTLHEREGNWFGYLSEAAKMLPYLTAAGHYKYGQQSLPLFLHEMKELPESAPEVHQAFMQGAFVGRRTDGYHNGVSPDMLLEQTYNKDAKETSGLDGITTNPAARTKWVYTKSMTATVSSQLKSMLHLDPHAEDLHHEGGHSRVEKDADAVLNVVAAIETNPFANNEHLINISTGQKANHEVQKQLLNVKEIGTNALTDSIQMKQKKTKTVKLQTFATQNKVAKSRKKTATKSDESVTLLRMVQVAASGGKVDLVHYIGDHECSKIPPSIFTEDGQMRSGNKANLVKAIQADTSVNSVSKLPDSQLKTALVVDAMFAIRHWSFHKNETFGQISQRYKHILLADVPNKATAIHFCCDRYLINSLKGAERNKRMGKTAEPKVYDIQEHIRAPEPSEFFSVSANKSGLQEFLCDTWTREETEKPSLKNVDLYLGGGFHEETKTVMISDGSITQIAELESTQEEADTRLVLHAIYSAQHDGCDRLVIHANDTDVIVLFIYYCSSLLHGVSEIWIRTDKDTYLPIHEMATALGPSRCRSLPFVHSLSGRDTTSYFYFTSKKVWLSMSKTHSIPALEEFAESSESCTIEENLIDQARHLLISVYSKQMDTDQTLAVLRAHKFLNNRSAILKRLPPTEGAFILHLKRAALATMIDKLAHVAKPQLPLFEDFGWVAKDATFVPVTTSEIAWPEEMARSISCTCAKGCGNRCSCVKRDVPCYIGCRCTGSQVKCSHARHLAELADLSGDGSDSSRDD